MTSDPSLPPAEPAPQTDAAPPRKASFSTWFREHWRRLGLFGALLAGFVIFFNAGNSTHSYQQWMFWDYAGYWLFAIVWNVCVFSGGFALLKYAKPTGIRGRERLVLSMAMGVFAFYIGAFFIGLAQQLNVWTLIGWPAVMLFAGLLPSTKFIARMVRGWKFARRAREKRWTTVELMTIAFGGACLFLLYLIILVPENTAYDARWYHLPLAEHYAAKGGIEPFREGWYQGALPHLSSYLYTWPMLLPKTHIVDKVETCAHLELSLFIWTLVSIPVLVRWLVPKANARVSWVAMFLFPGIFLYDSNLNTTADHIAAFWAIPVFLALKNAWRSLDARWCAVLGIMLCAAISTKYQTASLVVFPVMAIALRWAWFIVLGPTLRDVTGEGISRQRAMKGVTVAALAMVVLWSPHWLKNWAWYGDPLYPWGHKHFTSKVWTPDTVTRLQTIYDNHLWQPRGTTMQKLEATAKAVWTFSLIPNDWDAFHRNIPVFGSMFTMLMLTLPFIRARKRLWALFLCANVGVFVWYWMSHQDRYLQAMVPWMAAAVAATLWHVWTAGVLARLGTVLLVGFQLVWAGDVPFIGTHRQIGVSPLKLTIDRMASGFDGPDAQRNRHRYFAMMDVGAVLPKGARAVLHEEEPHLGVQAMIINDWSEWQGGLSYGRFATPAHLWDRYKEYGATHILTVPQRSRDRDSLPGDAVFFDFVQHYTTFVTHVGQWDIRTINPQRPAETPYKQLLWLGCPSLYEKGLYTYEHMMVPFWGERSKNDVPPPDVAVNTTDPQALAEALDMADAVGLDPRCQPLEPPRLRLDFVQMATRGPMNLWVRKRK